MKLGEQYREALDQTNASALARWGSRALRTIQAYASDERRVTMDAARELIAYLRHRSQELSEAADRLETALQEEENDGEA